jgi:hypothetical protein
MRGNLQRPRNDICQYDWAARPSGPLDSRRSDLSETQLTGIIIDDRNISCKLRDMYMDIRDVIVIDAIIDEIR